MNPGIKSAMDNMGDTDLIWLDYYHNVLYDVVMAVRGSPKRGPNYKDIEKALNYQYPTNTVVDFLRHAEYLRYITGRYGFYNRHGQGGAKCWFMSDPADYAEKADLYGALYAGKVPPYPYDWLNLVAEQGDNLTEYLKAHAIIIFDRDSMAVKHIARNTVDMIITYRKLYEDRYRFYSTAEKKELIDYNTPSPYIMAYYGKRDSPTPKDYNALSGRFKWETKLDKYF